MSDLTPLLRQWTILRALSARGRGCSVREMAVDAGVSEKTIRRDLDQFRRVGFPLEETTVERGRKLWRVGENGRRPPLSFTLDEALALYLGRRFLDPLAGTHFWDAAQRAFRKIKSTLGETTLAYLEKIAAAVHLTTLGAGDYSTKAEVIDRLMIGIEDRRITFITYQSIRSTEPVTYEVYPHGIVWHRHSLYLVAFSVSHEELRHFKIDRLSHVELETLKFNRPPDFNLQQHLADSFGIYRRDGRPRRIRVRFTNEVARYVEESRWHKSQKLTKHPDGSLLFEVTLTDTEEIKRWILSFGRTAEVLQPKHLAEEIREEAAAMLEQYPRKRPPTEKRSRTRLN